MLKKLFKYDFLSVRGVWWIIAIAMPIVSVIGALGLRAGLALTEEMPFIGIIGFFAFIISVIALCASLLITSVLVYYRFYKNLYSDEGYLTFTIPVSRRSILLSKTLNAMLWQTLHVILLIGCVFIYLIIAPNAENGIVNLEVFGNFFSLIGDAVSAIGPWLILYLPFSLLVLFSLQFYGTVLAELSITFGCVIASKYKLLVSVIIYYIVSFVMSLISQIVTVASTLFFFPALSGFLSDASTATVHIAILLLILIVAVAITALSLMLYYYMLGIVERKLNLA